MIQKLGTSLHKRSVSETERGAEIESENNEKQEDEPRDKQE